MFSELRKSVFKCTCPQRSPVLVQRRHFYKKYFFENQYVHNLFTKINTKCMAIGQSFLKQCNVVAAQRLRRSFHTIVTYRRIYGDNSFHKFLYGVRSTILKHCEKKSLFFLCGIPLFKWEDERIKDEELSSLVEDMKEIQHIQEDFKQPTDDKGYLKSWEKVIDKDHFKVWRKPLPNTHLYQYKVYGTFYDVTPRCFLSVQVDLNYRKEWDKRVIKLEVVDKDDETNTEVVQWITHFMYPMYSREYLYARRYKVDSDKNVMVLSSHAVEHPNFPVTDEHVRVHIYSSTMVIKPHKQFDDDGFDYVMTYYDDPQASYTSFCYSWLAKTGVPKFVDELHEAAKTLEKKRVQSGISSRQDVDVDHKSQYC